MTARATARAHILATVESLCSDLIRELPAGLAADSVLAVHSKLQEPLRVAVGGRLKAGKSTLVNALVGQRVAPVDAGECTRAVYWYRYGDDPRIEVVPSRAASYCVPFDRGAVPADLGRAPEEIDRVEVRLRLPSLKNIVIIDTPGLETLNEQYADKTKEFLGIGDTEQRAVSQADVLLYLMTQPKGNDLLTLESFRAAFPGAQLSALNALGILSRIDTLSGDDDPWTAARRHTTTYAVRLRTVLSTITPIIGKLAETVECGALTERHFSDLYDIAGLEPRVWSMMRRSADLFATYDKCTIPVERRDELLSLLGFYAAKQSVDWIRSGQCPSLGALLATLRAYSGIEDLKAMFAASFSERAAVLKASVALAHLSGIYWTHRDRHPVLEDLLDRIEAIERNPVMHQLQEAKVMRQVAGGKVPLPQERLDEIHRLLTKTDAAERVGLLPGSTPEGISAAAAAREAEWNGIEQVSRFSQQEIPRIIKQSYALLRETVSPA